jgi:hypothetical protein
MSSLLAQGLKASAWGLAGACPWSHRPFLALPAHVKMLMWE